MKITLLSDTHGMMHEGAWPFIQQADEVWHAGDLGPMALLDRLKAESKKLRAISGNADPNDILIALPHYLGFTVQGVSVLMLHIVGRPGRYTPEAERLQKHYLPHIVLCGHSHILLVAPQQLDGKPRPGTLHINPGAVGHHGFHSICTLITMEIGGGRVTALNAVELGPRGQKSNKRP